MDLNITLLEVTNKSNDAFVKVCEELSLYGRRSTNAIEIATHSLSATHCEEFKKEVGASNQYCSSPYLSPLPRGTVHGVLFPINYLAAFKDNDEVQELLNALSKFNKKETALRKALYQFIKLVGGKDVMSEGLWSIKSVGATVVTENDIKIDAFQMRICDDLKGAIDPIRDFSKKLDKTLGLNVFSQKLVKEPAGNIDLIINLNDVEQLSQLSEEKQLLLKRAMDNPRKFVQEQRRQSGFVGQIQAAIDDTWLSSTKTVSKTERSCG